MSVLYRCDECGEVAESEAAVGWVEVRPLGGHPLLPPEPTHLCRLCWARTEAAGHAARAPVDGEPQVSEHAQNRDLMQ
ncbi:MAG: hypothetical protein JWQ26_3547 [Modestobacter sp.]|nr:hypothetical protein [Modestobacter sp.]